MPRTILITGTTSGLGESLARRFAERGDRVLRVGRREAKSSDYFKVDLREENCGLRLEALLNEANVRHIDHIIHNAGIGYFGPPGKQSFEELNDLIRVNLYAPVAVTRALASRLLRASTPKLAFVSSVAASLPCPEYAAYAATKSALNGFARSLAIEFDKRVAVQVIVPGAMNTGMHAKMGLTKDRMDWERFPPVEDVAATVMRALDGGGGIATIGARNRCLRGFGRYLPGVMDVAVAFKSRGVSWKVAPTRSAPGSTVMVTGAARGIGRAISHRFARAGCRVIGVDIDTVELERAERAFEAEHLVFMGVEADLTTRDGVDAISAQLSRLQGVDAVVHNAGISWVGRFEDCAPHEARRVIDLNLRAPLALTAHLLREDLLRVGGALVFMSSLSNFTGYPGASVYAATKEGLASYARSLRAGIGLRNHVVTVYPGPTRTEHARRYSPDNSREARRMPPEDVADAVFDAVRYRRSVVVPGAANVVSGALGLYAPLVMDRITRGVLFKGITEAVVSARRRAKP